MLGNVDAMTFMLSKNEFWSLQQAKLKAMVRMSLSIPGMSRATYKMQQKIANAEAAGSFSLSGNTLNTTSWVQATETTNNMFMTKFTYSSQMFRHITLPLVATAVGINVILSLINGLKVFDLSIVLTNGGPGFSTEVLNSSVYKYFGNGAFSVGSAASLILFLFILGATLLVNKVFAKAEVDQ